MERWNWVWYPLRKHIHLSHMFNRFCWMEWYRKIWAWKLPLKLKCFGWLARRSKILTWESLGHRGFCGPDRCLLCRDTLKDMTHMLLICPIEVSIWITMLNILKIYVDWNTTLWMDVYKAAWWDTKNIIHSLSILCGAFGDVRMNAFLKIIHGH